MASARLLRGLLQRLEILGEVLGGIEGLLQHLLYLLVLPLQHLIRGQGRSQRVLGLGLCLGCSLEQLLLSPQALLRARAAASCISELASTY